MTFIIHDHGTQTYTDSDDNAIAEHYKNQMIHPIGNDVNQVHRLDGSNRHYLEYRVDSLVHEALYIYMYVVANILLC